METPKTDGLENDVCAMKRGLWDALYDCMWKEKTITLDSSLFLLMLVHGWVRKQKMFGCLKEDFEFLLVTLSKICNKYSILDGEKGIMPRIKRNKVVESEDDAFDFEKTEDFRNDKTEKDVGDATISEDDSKNEESEKGVDFGLEWDIERLFSNDWYTTQTLIDVKEYIDVSRTRVNQNNPLELKVWVDRNDLTRIHSILKYLLKHFPRKRNKVWNVIPETREKEKNKTKLALWKGREGIRSLLMDGLSFLDNILSNKIRFLYSLSREKEGGLSNDGVSNDSSRDEEREKLKRHKIPRFGGLWMEYLSKHPIIMDRLVKGISVAGDDEEKRCVFLVRDETHDRYLVKWNEFKFKSQKIDAFRSNPPRSTEEGAKILSLLTEIRELYLGDPCRCLPSIENPSTETNDSKKEENQRDESFKEPLFKEPSLEIDNPRTLFSESFSNRMLDNLRRKQTRKRRSLIGLCCSFMCYSFCFGFVFIVVVLLMFSLYVFKIRRG